MMDWFTVCKNDWEVYHDSTRIGMFVQKGKITPEQYQQITGEAYVTVA
jgi:uncharacterized XkdX family phage protein